MELILLSWEFAHDCWLIRNNKEHNMDGDPDTQNKVDLIETILSKSKKWENGIYDEQGLDTNILLKLPCKIIKMLLENIKNGRRNDR
jgi:hypothetical protein